MLPLRAVSVGWVVLGVAALFAQPGDMPEPATGQIDFAAQVQPILRGRCEACHGPANAMNGLRLDRRSDAMRGGHSGPAILPGNSQESRLVHMVAGYRVKVVMPPVGDPLSAAEIGVLRAWIDQGAHWPEGGLRGSAGEAASGEERHWAFQAIVRPSVPAGEHPVDHFVRVRLHSEGIEPAPVAERKTLLTRLTLDLIGLPPTPEEQRAFLEDGSRRAYARAVERLLASDHFGEKQAMHWLDQVRYADSDGYAKDLVRPHAWRYRRWVIDALNADMGFDQFSTLQIAGDLVPDRTVEDLVATGFHRNTLRNREGGVNPAEYAFEETVDRTSTFGTVWLGLTLGCAQCHDHKFDPLSQRDFYQVFAYFDNLEEAMVYAPLSGEMGPFLQSVNDYRREHQRILDEHDVPALQADWERRSLQAGANPGVFLDYDLAWQELGLNTDGGQEVVRIRPERRTWRQANMVTYYFLRAYSLVVGGEKAKELGFPDALRQLSELNRRFPQPSEARVARERASRRPTFLRVRGSWDRRGIEVSPRTPHALSNSAEPVADRLDLARWLFSEGNPLTARVAVNRVWQEYFGQGLVRTSEDFGTQGSPPSHPQLLDWLAAELRDNGWDIKHLHRLIVTSETYKQSARVPEDLAELDPSNVLLARQSRLRLPAELIWDRAMASSGLLHRDVGGRSFRPAMPQGTTGFKAGGTDWVPSSGAERYKRGMYIQFQRTQPFPYLVTFDSPDFRAPACRRERSNTPLQALNLLNDPTFAEAWRALAVRVLSHAPRASFRGRLRYAFNLALGREPTEAEVSRFEQYVEGRLAEGKGEEGDSAALPELRASTVASWWPGQGLAGC